MKALPFLLFLLLLTMAVPAPAQSPAPQHVFELRTYHAAPGKLEALHARFRNHTCKLLTKHGARLLGFWVPREGQPGAGETLLYVVEHASKEAADATWKAFRADPEWIAAKAESEKNGSLTTKVESLFMDPTDYSKMQ